MNKSKRFSIFIAAILLLSVILAGCSSNSTPAATAPAASSEPVTLRIAVLPILDALPMYVAQQEGIFEKHNVKVEFIPVASAAERDQVITAGQADGMINEVVATQFYNKDSIQIQIVRFARTATATAPQYYILSSPQSGITAVDGLKGVDIGISQGTVIEYLTDRLLQAEGFSSSDIQTIAVPKISDRMTLLASGELPAAMLPDPLSFLAMQQGAQVVLNDSKHPEYAYSTISFRKPVIDASPEAIRGFLAAIEDATQQINADPNKWTNLLSEQKLVPDSLIGDYKISPYPTASVPSQAQWDDVSAWMKEKGLLDKEVSYEQSVNASFLP